MLLPGKSSVWIHVQDCDLGFEILMRGGDNIKAIYVDHYYARQFLLSNELSSIFAARTDLESFTASNRGIEEFKLRY